MVQLLAKALTPEGLALLITGGAALALYLIWRQIYNHIPSQLKEIRAEMRQNNTELRAEMQQNNTELRAEMQQNNTELRAEMRQIKADQDRRIDRLEDNILKEIRLLKK